MNPDTVASGANALTWSGWTDRGKVRSNNEDSFIGLCFDAREVHRLGKFGEASLAQTDFAFAVSDGMGGARAGEFASRIAVEKLMTLMPRAYLQAAKGLNAGHDDVMTELFGQVHSALAYLGSCYEECEGMEATLSVCWFVPGWMHYGHIGDSRIYYLPQAENRLKQLSEDHTHVGWLYRQGKISEWEARNHPRRSVLQKALGGSNQFVEPQIGAVGYVPGDIFLLCTDGLIEGLHNDRLVELLRPEDGRRISAETAARLVAASVELHGRDNTTALVVQAQ